MTDADDEKILAALAEILRRAVRRARESLSSGIAAANSVSTDLRQRRQRRQRREAAARVTAPRD
jgi:hypothetical protein